MTEGYHWTFDADEFERRLRETGALGDCKACGSPGGSSRLDPALGKLETAQGNVMIYLAICSTCGHVELFTPSVFAAWADHPEGIA